MMIPPRKCDNEADSIKASSRSHQMVPPIILFSLGSPLSAAIEFSLWSPIIADLDTMERSDRNVDSLLHPRTRFFFIFYLMYIFRSLVPRLLPAFQCCMLPGGYTYKMVTVTHFKDLDSFTCELQIKLETEESVRKWVADYNEKTKETMVYECCKNQSGKRVLKNCT